MSDPAVDLSVVLVSWNTAPLTLRALGAVPAGTAPLVAQRICVDNGSRDGTVERIRRRHPDVQLLECVTNLGFARAANRALPLLRGRYTCFLNSDARPRAGALAHLARWLDDHPEAALVAPAVVDGQGRPQVVGRPEPSRLALLHETTILGTLGIGRRAARAWRAGLGGPTPREVPSVVGACLVVRTACLHDLAGFDEGYFFYWEDTDLCRAVRARGGGVWLVPDGPAVEHQGGASTPPRSASHRLAFLAGLLRYVRKEMPPPAGDAYAAVAVLGFWFRAWRKALLLPLRAGLRRLRRRPADAARAWGDAAGWIGVLERQGLDLLRLLRRMPLRRGIPA